MLLQKNMRLKASNALNMDIIRYVFGTGLGAPFATLSCPF